MGRSKSDYPVLSAEGVTLNPSASLMRAIKAIDHSDARIALVVNPAGKLVGTVTDGDIRRGLLGGCTLQSAVREVMNRTPYTLPVSATRKQIMEALQGRLIRQVPLLKADDTIAGIAVYEMLEGQKEAPRPNAVVIMAGGKGKRLMPITKDIPKPMVEVAGRPMLEWIIQRFVQQGFSRFFLAVNYKAHVIEEHFGDGSAFGCAIEYLREERFLGTAGALSLIDPKTLRDPFLVINGDILVSIDFGNIIDYHMESGNEVTLCARPHRIEIPFGVVSMDGDRLTAITEKPVREEMVSAGIYVMQPDVLPRLPASGPLDMPDLLRSLVGKRRKVGVFPMPEEWVDVGRPDDLRQVQRDFGRKEIKREPA